MKNAIRKMVFVSCLLYPFIGTGQAIQIGQVIPDVKLTHIINYPVTKARLSDFKEKLIILDFWGTGCAGCIMDFSRFGKLQKIFSDKIQIIMVNKESEDSTKHFFSLHPKIKLPDAIPFVTGDSALSSYFPHRLVPHDVWIDSNNIVRFITEGYNTTSKHIQTFLEGKPMQLSVKNDNFNYVWYKPLIATLDSAQLSKVYYYSYLMPKINGYSIGVSREKVHGSKMINKIGLNTATLLRLYTVAYSEGGKYDFWPRNSIILKVPDTSIFILPKDDNLKDQFIANHTYAYELLVPPSMADQLYNFMQQDLIRYFGYEGIIKKMKVKCLVLMKTGEDDRLHSKGGEPRTNLFSRTQDTIRFFINKPFAQFEWYLKGLFEARAVPAPFIDATGYKGNIDLSVNSSVIENILDISNLNKALKKYGLILKRKKWLTNVLIIRKVHQ